jgi:hypothetical protein
MKRVLAIAIAVAFAPLAGAQLYKYVDKDGKTVYTDQPPANVDSKPVYVPKSPPPPAAPAKNGAPGSKTAMDKDKELEKGRGQARDQQKKQEEAAEKERLAEQRCTQARTAFRQFSEGGRIVNYNEKGERVYLSDAEIEAGREKSRQEMEEACKKS